MKNLLLIAGLLLPCIACATPSYGPTPEEVAAINANWSNPDWIAGRCDVEPFGYDEKLGVTAPQDVVIGANEMFFIELHGSHDDGNSVFTFRMISVSGGGREPVKIDEITLKGDRSIPVSLVDAKVSLPRGSLLPGVNTTYVYRAEITVDDLSEFEVGGFSADIDGPGRVELGSVYFQGFRLRWDREFEHHYGKTPD